MFPEAPLRTTRLLPALLVVCAFLAGAAPGAQTQTPSMPGYPAVGAPATVSVLSPGAEPRKQLRYSIAPTLTQTMDMTTAISMSMNLGGMAMPMDMPTMKMSADLAVTGIATNGDITYSIAFTGMTAEGGADANPMVAQMMAGAADSIKAIKGTATVSNRGVVKSSKLDIGDPTLQQVLGQAATSLENVSMPFPEEAIGVGAKWEVRNAVTSGGQTSFQKSIYELVSIDGPTVSLKATTEQTAPPQSVSNPALPAGTEMALEKLTGTGTGTIVIRLDSLVPTSQAESSVTMSMSISMGGMSQPVTSDMKMKMSVAPGKK